MAAPTIKTDYSLMRLGVGFVCVVEGLVFFELRQLDGDSFGAGLFQIVAVEASEHNSDVILTTAIIRFGN